MKRSKRILCLVFAVTMVFGMLTPNTVYAKKKSSTVQGIYHQTDARKMLKKVNSLRKNDAWYRDKNGKKIRCGHLEKLEYDYSLEKVAMERAAELSVSYSHTRPNGLDCFSLYDYGYDAMGENIAMGQSTTESAFEAWAERKENYSRQGHRRNMLDEDFGAIGIACFEVNGIKYWTQEFADTSSGSEKTKAANKRKTVKIDYTGADKGYYYTTCGGSVDDGDNEDDDYYDNNNTVDFNPLEYFHFDDSDDEDD